VGIRVNVFRFLDMHEMFLTGTAAKHPLLPASCCERPVTSDLTGEETWATLGIIGGIKAMFRGFVRGEIGDLTSMIYDAREQVFARLHDEAAQAGASKVVGVKSYIAELGPGLVEFVAVGTAVRKVDGMGTVSDSLPAPAIIRDRDTWVNGDYGLDFQSARPPRRTAGPPSPGPDCGQSEEAAAGGGVRGACQRSRSG
jgi:uncharacterized protein YbjQ (UPF0145 family)